VRGGSPRGARLRPPVRRSRSCAAGALGSRALRMPAVRMAPVLMLDHFDDRWGQGNVARRRVGLARGHCGARRPDDPRGLSTTLLSLSLSLSLSFSPLSLSPLSLFLPSLSASPLSPSLPLPLPLSLSLSPSFCLSLSLPPPLSPSLPLSLSDSTKRVSLCNPQAARERTSATRKRQELLPRRVATGRLGLSGHAGRPYAHAQRPTRSSTPPASSPSTTSRCLPLYK
jgi:hypothetical protein